MIHESAIKHVTGEAIFVNDIDINNEMLIGHVVYSKYAHAKITSINIDKAKALSGVYAVLSFKDIPGENQMGPVIKDEICLAEKEVTFIGQAIILIAAKDKDIALEAEKLIEIKYEPLDVILDLETAIEKNNLLAPPRKIERGEVEKALKKSKHRINGVLKTGAQEHWYLETQSCLCVPGEDRNIKAYSSTQHPSETQAIIAEVLGIKSNEVEVEVRRIGGGFGGKETQANHISSWCALLCNATKKPVKIHLFRDDDQIMTGKRHRFLSKYEIGFDDEGIINAYSVELNSDAGAATDLSMAILERGMLHSDNAYYIPNMRVIGKAYKTNLPSNTALRGFGGPQGIAVIETAIDRIARFLKKDAAEIRYKNFYKSDKNNFTHYGEEVENNRLQIIFDKIIKSSDYKKRREEVNEFNSKNEFEKKGLAITPVKFGISFTTAFLNQAGALVNIYKDGSVLVNHGGTEMGQGLYTKIHGIASAELGISPEYIIVNATNTSKVPNTSATAASSGSDMNGFAVKNAIDKLKERLSLVAFEMLKNKFTLSFPHVLSGNPSVESNEESKGDIIFQTNFVYHKKYPDKKISFKELISTAYLNQVSLSATGFYKTPDIWFDREKGVGHPFHYFAFGMAVSEVLVDILTGYHKILRTDILHDVGNSLNEEIDKGQVVGGFIQGVGWCTTEDIKWDEKGNLLNHSPDTYKIPTIQDIPTDFRVELLEDYPNPNTIRSSKAVGEPPLMLAFSVWLAIKDAISAVGEHETEPEFSLPATKEVIVLSVEKLRKH
ncbi:MAG: xanthine dehydrogenase molybdopterin binding subunit [Ignavibacteriae bacterium]|nr:xanthine dehydrogenase molybdopterin binding subunit [Ignavibacteriota bacterium]